MLEVATLPCKTDSAPLEQPSALTSCITSGVENRVL